MSASRSRLDEPCRSVVFDLDGTLVDSLCDLTDSLNHALRELGLRAVGADLVRSSLHAGLKGTAAAALEHVGADPGLLGPLSLQYREHYDRAPARGTVEFPGVSRCLQRLADAGYSLAVCTNKPERTARAVLEALDLSRFFVCVVGGDTCAHMKPHPAPLLRALAELGVSPGAAQLVGDSRVDLACARAAGVRFLFFAAGYDPEAATEAGTLFDRFSAFEALDVAPGAGLRAG